MARLPSWEPVVLCSSAVQCRGPLANVFLSVSCLSGVTGLHGLMCVTQALSLLIVQLHPFPSLMWHQPLRKTLALAPRGSWEPIPGGLHFLKLDSCIFPSKSIL